jgi:hypothetical protein
MVRATVNIEETEHYDLKTLAGGFVVLRRLSYGEKLHRRAMVSKMAVEEGQKKGSMRGEMQLINELATQYDFRNCIVDHNLEDEGPDGELRKLRFDVADDLRKLDPRVGEEIDKLISDMNNFELEEDDGTGN